MRRPGAHRREWDCRRKPARSAGRRTEEPPPRRLRARPQGLFPCGRARQRPREQRALRAAWDRAWRFPKPMRFLSASHASGPGTTVPGSDAERQDGEPIVAGFRETRCSETCRRLRCPFRPRSRCDRRRRRRRAHGSGGSGSTRQAPAARARRSNCEARATRCAASARSRPGCGGRNKTRPAARRDPAATTGG